MPVRLGRFSGAFELDGDAPTPKAKRALLERWVNEVLALPPPRDGAWINLISRIEAVLLPSGSLAKAVRDQHDAFCALNGDAQELALSNGFRPLLERGAELLADLGDGDPPWSAPPRGEADSDAIRTQSDVLAELRDRLREGDDAKILQTSLYAPLYLLAWFGLDEGTADLVSLPVRVAFAEDLASLGARGALTRPADIRAALRRAVDHARRLHPKLRFDTSALDLSTPAMFAATFVRALRKISLGDPRSRRVVVPRRPMPPPVPRFAEDPPKRGNRPPRTRAFDAELRSDHALLLARGLAMVGAREDAPPELVVEKVHAFVGAVQKKKRRLASNKARACLAVAWGEQIVRALGWQWTRIVYPEGKADGTAGVVSPDRSLAHFPLSLITRLARASARENTIALVFNTLRDGDRPPGAKPGSFTPVE